MNPGPAKLAPTISGQAVRGDGRGKSLGFPTANLKLATNKKRPPDGVYACHATLQNEKKVYQATLHIGPRPTFNAVASIEVHLLDFPYRELYGLNITCRGLIHLRPVKKFSSREDLVSALTRDAMTARRALPI